MSNSLLLLRHLCGPISSMLVKIEKLGDPIRDPIRKFSLSNAFFEIIGLACGLRHADWFLPSEIMTFKPQANPLKSGLGNPQSAKC